MADPPGPPPASEELLDDVVVMTRQAAVDGLPLTAVFDDLRLVLDLEPSDDVPADVLRTCALAWAETHQALAAPGRHAVEPGTREDLENHLWGLLADPTTEAPDLVLVVTPTRANAVLRDADVLLVAASDLHTVFDRPGERVTLVRSTGAPDRVVVLARADEDRIAVVRARLREFETTVHDLGGHRDGMLAALRSVLDER